MAQMTHLCERCRYPGELYHCRAVDEYLCESCAGQVAREEEADADA